MRTCRVAPSEPGAFALVLLVSLSSDACHGSDVFLGGGAASEAGASGDAAVGTGAVSGSGSGGGLPASGGAGGAVSGSAGTASAGLGQFGTPELVEELSDPDPAIEDDDPTLSPDMREIFFSSTRAGGLGQQDVWWSTRASTSDPWSTPVNVTEVNSVSSETSVALSRDGLTLYIGTDREGVAGAFDVWMSTRDARGSPWTAPVTVPELNTDGPDAVRSISGTGLVAAVMSAAGGSSRYDLFLARRADASSSWTPPVPIAELNTGENEADPFLTPNELMLFFTATREGETQGDDLFVATRASTSDAFADVQPLSTLNGAGRDSDAWVSDDLRTIYFAAEAGGEVLHIYEAAR